MTSADSPQSAAAQSCFHCALPIPPQAFYPVIVEGQQQLMCCPGCQAVAMAIVDGGLENFYRYRATTAANGSITSAAVQQVQNQSWDIYDLVQVQAEFVVPLDERYAQANLLLEGISCAACSWLIETHLKTNPAVRSISINLGSHRCALVWDRATPLSHLLKALAAIGYVPRPATDDQAQQLIKKENRIALFRLGVAGFGMMQAMMVAVGLYTGASGFWLDFLRWLSMLVATPVVFFSAWPFFQAAWRSVQSRQLVMDVPVALAIALAYSASVWATLSGSGEVYFESVSMFTFFLLLGRYFELRARHRNRLAYGNLAQLMPLTACCLVAQQGCDLELQQPLSMLKLGDRVLVKPGDTFPCDGRVVAGESAVVEALLTGEAEPIAKGLGDMVIAGTLNQQSPLQVEVTALGAATQLSAIERLATQAEQEKPQQVLVADKIARFFIARLLLVASVVFWFWFWYEPARALWVTLSVLVVTCPCALALAMPAALSAATANLRKRGFLVTRGHVVETLQRINHLVFDKTGTLTRGQFSVASVQAFSPDGRVKEAYAEQRQQLLDIVSALEAESNHPLASAFTNRLNAPKAQNVKYFAAQGIEAQIEGCRYRVGTPAFASSILAQSESLNPGIFSLPDTQSQWLLLCTEQQPLAWIGVQDELRPDAQELMQQLRAQGYKLSLLSGDTPERVAALAQHLGISSFKGGATPADKLAQLSLWQAQGDKVLMLGDGINDVPVLAGADVSVAMASASDLAQTRADGVLLSNRLLVLLEALGLARATHNIIKQNLAFALLYNLLALPLAAAGLVPPWLAALGMTSSSLIVVFNALRLMRY